MLTPLFSLEDALVCRLFLLAVILLPAGCAITPRPMARAQDPNADVPIADIDVYVQELPGPFQIVD